MGSCGRTTPFRRLFSTGSPSYSRRVTVFDHYQTIATVAESKLRVERSEFISFAFPIASPEEFAPEIERLERRFHDATHVCWGWRLASDGNFLSRSADAGEPSGTAGKPILGAIESAALFDVGVAVVRYYGGIKLGTGGLVRAYRQAAEAALAEAPRVDRFLYSTFEIETSFEGMSAVYRMLEPPSIVLAGEEFSERVVLRLEVRRSRTEAFSRTLQEARYIHRILS